MSDRTELPTVPDADPERCETCRFWEPCKALTDDNEKHCAGDEDFGRCKRYPPVYTPVIAPPDYEITQRVFLSFNWSVPVTYASFECGEWTAKTSTNTAESATASPLPLPSDSRLLMPADLPPARFNEGESYHDSLNRFWDHPACLAISRVENELRADGLGPQGARAVERHVGRVVHNLLGARRGADGLYFPDNATLDRRFAVLPAIDVLLQWVVQQGYVTKKTQPFVGKTIARLRARLLSPPAAPTE